MDFYLLLYLFTISTCGVRTAAGYNYSEIQKTVNKLMK